MPSLVDYVENALGRALYLYRGHDAKLFINTPPFKPHPKPTITVTSPECGDSIAELQVKHTPLGENRFPELTWQQPPALIEGVPRTDITQYLLVVEDPDAPLPSPVVHGIYYDIPAATTSLAPEDFALAAPPSGSKNALHGGFKYGLNRMKSVWGGPKPVLGHGPHRYMFQVVGLSSAVEGGRLSEIATRAELEKAIDAKVVAWGMWVGTFERKLE